MRSQPHNGIMVKFIIPYNGIINFIVGNKTKQTSRNFNLKSLSDLNLKKSFRSLLSSQLNLGLGAVARGEFVSGADPH